MSYTLFNHRELARPVFGPLAIGLQLVGAAVTAAGTIAAGNAQKASADYQAAELRQNALTAQAKGQRIAEDRKQQTNLLISKATAQAAGSGVNAAEGSPLENEGQIRRRGEYQALLDVYNGQEEATGLENQAKGAEFTGKAAQTGSRYAALGTIAGSAGGALRTYGAFAYPTAYGRPGVSFG